MSPDKRLTTAGYFAKKLVKKKSRIFENKVNIKPKADENDVITASKIIDLIMTNE